MDARPLPAFQTLENFVSNAQEAGKKDSQRSANVSIIAMVAGTLLSIVGGLMLIETLRGPLKRVTETMTRGRTTPSQEKARSIVMARTVPPAVISSLNRLHVCCLNGLVVGAEGRCLAVHSIGQC